MRPERKRELEQIRFEAAEAARNGSTINDNPYNFARDGLNYMHWKEAFLQEKRSIDFDKQRDKEITFIRKVNNAETIEELKEIIIDLYVKIKEK